MVDSCVIMKIKLSKGRIKSMNLDYMDKKSKYVVDAWLVDIIIASFV